jgi:hypothetical protein
MRRDWRAAARAAGPHGSFSREAEAAGERWRRTCHTCTLGALRGLDHAAAANGNEWRCACAPRAKAHAHARPSLYVRVCAHG